MVTIAEYSIRPDEFPLGRSLMDLGDSQIKVDHLRRGDECLSFYLWITDLDSPSLATSFAEHEIFSTVDQLDSFQNEYLFRCGWNPKHEGVLVGISNLSVEIESVSFNHETWTIRLRSDSSEHLSEFQAYCTNNNFKIKLSRFPTLYQIFDGREYDLTEKQHEALVLAFTKGYFNQPRDVTLEDIATPLGITREALTSRLRTGQRNLLESTIVRSANIGGS